MVGRKLRETCLCISTLILQESQTGLQADVLVTQPFQQMNGRADFVKSEHKQEILCEYSSMRTTQMMQQPCRASIPTIHPLPCKENLFILMSTMLPSSHLCSTHFMAHS